MLTVNRVFFFGGGGMTACSHLSFQQVSHTSPEQSQPTLFSSNPPDLVVLWHGPQPSLHPTDK